VTDRDIRATAGRLASGILAVVLLAPLAACLDRSQPAAAVAPETAPPGATPARRFAGPVLGADGRCEAAPAGTARAIEAGIGECDLVRLKGSPPTDVLVGESGRGSREVQVLYNEPGGRELYFFVDNRLDRIVK
jgi:hypothetical protein